MSEEIDLDRVESSKNKSDILTKPMDQETLNRHLASLGYYYLEWLSWKGGSSTNEKKRHDGNSGSIAVALQRAVAEALVSSLLKVNRRSV